MRLLAGLDELILRKRAWLTTNTHHQDYNIPVTGTFSNPPIEGRAMSPPGPVFAENLRIFDEMRILHTSTNGEIKKTLERDGWLYNLYFHKGGILL